MRIRVVSDLHFEFQPDGGVALSEKISAGSFEALVVAGDLSDAGHLDASLRTLALSTTKPILVIHGNHEYYGADRESVLRTTRNVVDSYPNLHFLDNDTFTVGEIRFRGTTLWFPESNAPKWAMNDFAQIRDFESWVYENNRQSQEFLGKWVRPGDVVVTHHLPHPKCVDAKYKRNPLNPFFLCDMSRVIEKQSPALWIFGHTHTRTDFTVGETRLVCNPYGYQGYEDTGFDPGLTIEI